MDALDEFSYVVWGDRIAAHEITWTWPHSWIAHIDDQGTVYVALRVVAMSMMGVTLGTRDFPTAVAVRHR